MPRSLGFLWLHPSVAKFLISASIQYEMSMREAGYFHYLRMQCVPARITDEFAKMLSTPGFHEPNVLNIPCAVLCKFHLLGIHF